MKVFEEKAMDRVLVLHWNGVIDGTGPVPEQIRSALIGHGARLLLLDATRSPYASSDGIRLHLGLEVFESVGGAWKAPWNQARRPALHRERRQGTNAALSRLRRRIAPGSSA